jgi:hypothetical protein
MFERQFHNQSSLLCEWLKNNDGLANAYFFRESRTPERVSQSEREQQQLEQLQMTSPSIRKQREYDWWQPIAQPNFAGPSNAPIIAAAPVQGKIDWQQRLEQGFQSQHAQWLQNCGRQHLEPNESLSATAVPFVPVQGRVDQHMPIAGPSAPIQGRVDWQERLEHGFWARYNPQLQTHGREWQEWYAEEEQVYVAHLAELQEDPG